MRSRHISFCVEPAYGHIIPTLGITLELVRRGHTVSHVVTESFSPIVRKVHAHPKIILPLDNRSKIVSAFLKENDCFAWKVGGDEATELSRELTRERTADSLAKLEYLYQDDKPDVIIY